MARRAAFKLPLVMTVAAALGRTPRATAQADGPRARWSPERAHRWYAAQGWLVGANFIPSNAVNQLEMFQPATYDPQRIDRELRIARLAGLNTVRVFLHDQLWAQDHVGFLNRLAQFVALASSHGIKPLFVLFDSCWDPFPRLGRQRRPQPGIHNSAWVQSPGAQNLDSSRYRRILREYVVGVIGQFRHDDRVLGWDLWNEPDNPAATYREVERQDKIKLIEGLLPQVFGWARSVNPVQPLTSGVWDGPWADPRQRSAMANIQLDHSDVVTFHSYDDPAGFEARIGELAPMGRPILCTEYLARGEGSTIEGVLPVAKRHNVGAYTWGLVAGKTQTYLPWDSWDRPYRSPPRLWFHDLFHADGRPYRDGEIRTIQELTGRPYP
ncbi:1,4-beta-xylanase [Mycolicibacterium houstonense]|uniref:1,4-beta-xylanase n=1 Tax=Mycolicibacterium houstonense TaxID=146021 RepID=UPI0008374AD5|nr:1,4-beta-xylanase [Mycolicibacterium houstonense]MCV7067668.1 1,4-beta-xylanase [Mycolicibacterium farcinogenes]